MSGRIDVPWESWPVAFSYLSGAAVLPFDVLKEQLPSNSINPVSGFGGGFGHLLRGGFNHGMMPEKKTEMNNIHDMTKRYKAELLRARTTSCQKTRLAHEQMARAYAKCIAANKRARPTNQV